MAAVREPILNTVAIEELRFGGGYAKGSTPFSEFLWADFMRRRMKRKLVEDDRDQALEQARHLSRSEDANYMPGWCGPIAQ